MDSQTVTAILPMKAHSERVPGKNTRRMCGRPLFAWVLGALTMAERVAQIVVDTDSCEIGWDVQRRFPHVRILARPDALRGDHVTGNPLTQWAISQVAGEHFLQTHATNPLLSSATIDRAIDRYFERLAEHDSLLTVTRHRLWLYNSRGQAINHDPHHIRRHQDDPPLFADNSNLYLFSRASFAAATGRVGLRPQLFEMNKIESVDIDYEEDWQIAEALLWRRAYGD